MILDVRLIGNGHCFLWDISSMFLQNVVLLKLICFLGNKFKVISMYGKFMSLFNELSFDKRDIK